MVHPNAEAYALKDLIDSHLGPDDGFESYLFTVGSYNSAVGPDFQLPHNENATGIVILSTPAMFDVSFKRWFTGKLKELGSLEAVSEQISSPLQQFMEDRLTPIIKQLGVPFELLHDYSMWPSRKPKILMQTCGHISGAAFYYQPSDSYEPDSPPVGNLDKNSKFIGLSLHPVYGGHFAFRSVFLFPSVQMAEFQPLRPPSILESPNEIRNALEKFNFSWRDSNFRDFGGPKQRYSALQMEFFGKPPAERWEVLREWC